MRTSKFFDRIAITLSAVCIVHCLTLPVLVALLPVVAASIGSDSHFHALMMWLVVPVSVGGFALGYRVHQRKDIVVGGGAAVIVLAIAALWGHSVWNEYLEVVVSVIASFALATAHLWNFREVRRLHTHVARRESPCRREAPSHE